MLLRRSQVVEATAKSFEMWRQFHLEKMDAADVLNLCLWHSEC